MSLTNRQYLRLMEAAIKRWSELTLDDLAKDLKKVEHSDEISQWAVRAYWEKLTNHVLKLHELHPKPKTPEEELRLVEKVFGHMLDLPAHHLAADVDARLEWIKRRIGKQFENEIKTTINAHNISSPIEQIFLMEWKFAKIEELLSVQLAPQLPVETTDGRFTLDFAVTHNNPALRSFRIGIELDGHEFHEKTKNQVVHDKQRERAIVRAGVSVMRFSGSEVYRNARKCVSEIADYIRNQTAEPGACER